MAVTSMANSSIRDFTKYNNMSATFGENLFEYLVIAGGGGGGSNVAGGGGAGGYRSSVVGELSGGNTSAESRVSFNVGTSFTVTVGAGGTGTLNSGDTVRGGVGANSVFGNIVSLGGGGGGTYQTNKTGLAGGSGGGGCPLSAAGGAGTSAQGFAGGAGDDVEFPSYYAGGGGGASEIGFEGGSQGSKAGDGGDGLASTITGTSVIRAGGGGGGAADGGYVPGNGGSGGGGNGSAGDTDYTGSAGTVNTGGGGGGGWTGTVSNRGGFAGGSGIVILRYPAALTLTPGAGLTHSTTTVGPIKITTFTAGTDTVTVS